MGNAESLAELLPNFREEKVFEKHYRRVTRNASDWQDPLAGDAVSHKPSVLFLGFTSHTAEPLVRRFEETGWHTLEIKNSIKAVALLRQIGFNLVVVSIEGADQYGPTLVADLRDVVPVRPRTRIVAVCNFAEDGFISQLMRAGLDVLWSHPF